jgi:hypothetical protein
MTTQSLDEVFASWRAACEPNPWSLLANVARAEVGINGFDHADRIRDYWRACPHDPDGWQRRAPWAAAFVAWCVARAAEFDRRLQIAELPAFSQSQDWIDYCDDLATRVTLAEALPGDIVTSTWRVASPAFTVGIVFERGPGLIVTTIEGDILKRQRYGVHLVQRAPILPSCGAIWRLPSL